MGIESQQAVRDVRIDRGDKSGDGPYFILVYIARDKEGTGYK
jgi:hypothetical protein